MPIFYESLNKNSSSVFVIHFIKITFELTTNKNALSVLNVTKLCLCKHITNCMVFKQNGYRLMPKFKCLFFFNLNWKMTCTLNLYVYSDKIIKWPLSKFKRFGICATKFFYYICFDIQWTFLFSQSFLNGVASFVKISPFLRIHFFL